MKPQIKYLYAIREKATGKLRSDINHSGRKKKFWERRADCINALNNYANYKYRTHNLWDADTAERIKKQFEIVEFSLTEEKVIDEVE